MDCAAQYFQHKHHIPSQHWGSVWPLFSKASGSLILKHSCQCEFLQEQGSPTSHSQESMTLHLTWKAPAPRDEPQPFRRSFSQQHVAECLHVLLEFTVHPASRLVVVQGTCLKWQNTMDNRAARRGAIQICSQNRQGTIPSRRCLLSCGHKWSPMFSCK